MNKTFKLIATLAFSNIAHSQTTSPGPLTIPTSTFGNVVIGSDANFGYLNTSQSRFLFNKDLYSTTGGFSSNTSNLSFKTSGTTRMTVLNSNGFVGVGTTSPTNTLHVVGDIFLPASSSIKFGSATPTSGYLKISNQSCCFNSYADFGEVYTLGELQVMVLQIKELA